MNIILAFILSQANAIIISRKNETEIEKPIKRCTVDHVFCNCNAGFECELKNCESDDSVFIKVFGTSESKCSMSGNRMAFGFEECVLDMKTRKILKENEILYTASLIQSFPGGIVVNEKTFQCIEKLDRKTVSTEIKIKAPSKGQYTIIDGIAIANKQPEMVGLVDESELGIDNLERNPHKLINDDEFYENGNFLHDSSSFKTNLSLTGLSLSYVLFLI